MLINDLFEYGPYSIPLLILAGYRLTRMLLMEEGPFSIFERLRGWVYNNASEGSIFIRGMECVFCSSVYIVIFLLPSPWVVAHVVGVMGGASLIFEWWAKQN